MTKVRINKKWDEGEVSLVLIIKPDIPKKRALTLFEGKAELCLIHNKD